MKVYLRILSYGAHLRGYLAVYVVTAFLSIIFGLLNLTLLKPLFDLIFEQLNPEKLAEYASEPIFSISADYFMHVFYFYLLQAIEEQGKMGSLFYLCILIFISVFLANLFRYWSEVILAVIRASVIKGMRFQLFKNITALHIGFFTSKRSGDIISRITNDVQEVEFSIVHSLRVVFKEPATIIVYFVVLFTISTELTFFSLLIIPVIGGMISEIARRLKKIAKKSQESLGRIVNIVDETLTGMRIIKAFGAQEYINNKFHDEIGVYNSVNVSMARKNELASPLSQFLGVALVMVLLLYGGSLILQEQPPLDASSFLIYILIFSQLLPPSKEISKAISSIQRGLASAERIFQLVDTQSEIQDTPLAVPIEGFKESVVFENVFFTYEDRPVLENINLEVQKGKTIALVGPSGGGKSTIADLIPRFYDPKQGEILLDGKPIRGYTLKSLRKLMGVVTQESLLFHDTIFNNIAFGMDKVDQDEVIKAAKVANAHEFILETERGYQTNIGDRGTKLSGGQRQRLAIARAIIKNPPILILDEATSALDTESEKLVQEALTRLMLNRTTVVIAHRLSTIQGADEIVVVEKGRIVERGTHSELLEKGGLYKKLTILQSA